VNKVWAVVRREFLERVRSKWFLISTILGPVFMIGIGVLPSLLITKVGRDTRVVIVNSGAGALADRVEVQLARSGRFRITVLGVDELDSSLVDSLTALVRTEASDGFLMLTGSTLEAGQAEYRGRNVSSLVDMEILSAAVRSSVVIERLTRRGIDPTLVQEAQGRIELRTLRISRRGATGETGQATFFLGYAIALILYMVIMIYGMNVMRSVVEEKQTRIIEVLVSSLKPFQLMLGKVVGVGGVGLFQVSIWAFAAYAMVTYRSAILGIFKVPPEAVSRVQLPAMGGDLLALVLVYFLLGYLMYSALFAVVGASVNTETEAQQAQQPVMMLLVASLILSIGSLSDPNGQLARIGSLVPLSSPIIMPVRAAASDVPASQIWLSLGILAASVAAVVWVSARVYRIGILMYGKRPSLREILRWARES
jgi:ABC-2 type transport system permease protein